MKKQKIAMRYPGLLPSLFSKRLRRGGILIISLWLLFLLAFFSAITAGLIKQKLIVAQRIDKGFKAYTATLAAIEISKAAAGQIDEKNHPSGTYRWYNDERIFKHKHLGEAFYNVAYTLKTESGSRIIYGLIDCERKINLNIASQEVLVRLFEQAGIIDAKRIVASIIDWRDKDSEITDAGAENTYYNTLKDPYNARNAALKSIYELLLVRGMSAQVFAAIQEYITVYGSGTVNVNTASKEVLLALGLEHSLVAKIISYRDGSDRELFTDDDRTFENPSRIIPELESFAQLSSEEESQLQDALKRNTLGTEAAYFEIRATGASIGKEETSRIDCVIAKTGKVLFWHER